MPGSPFDRVLAGRVAQVIRESAWDGSDAIGVVDWTRLVRVLSGFEMEAVELDSPTDSRDLSTIVLSAVTQIEDIEAWKACLVSRGFVALVGSKDTRVHSALALNAGLVDLEQFSIGRRHVTIGRLPAWNS